LLLLLLLLLLTRSACSYDGVEEFPQWLIQVRLAQ
jgi:hypothetical protein